MIQLIAVQLVFPRPSTRVLNLVIRPRTSTPGIIQGSKSRLNLGEHFAWGLRCEATPDHGRSGEFRHGLSTFPELFRREAIQTPPAKRVHADDDIKAIERQRNLER